MQLRPKFYEECPPELLAKWNAREEYHEFTNSSLLYLRSLKTSDDSARYAKFAGLTLGVVGVDQPEELPPDVFTALKARLSQVGFPHQMLLTPNPPAPNHWLAQEFPDGGDLPNHRYIRTSIYDNRAIIGEEYIAELEREYPEGHVLRRRYIDGVRGLSTEGQPVYGAIFSRNTHVRARRWEPAFPLIESWDFGQRHPAVSWHQFLPDGRWNILAEYLGTRQFIDEAIQAVTALRHERFPGLLSLRVCCDPAGADIQGHGLRRTAVDVLNQHLTRMYGPQMGASFVPGSNSPKTREFCIQSIAGYMTRLVRGEPALAVDPSCPILVDGFEAGYVYDDRSFSGGTLPNIRRAKKDGYYDHLQNCVEYVVANYGPRALTVPLAPMSSKERLRAEQMDYDESDVPRRRTSGRAGY
jgi:hypothetical protein